jgi:hypothetical protein
MNTQAIAQHLNTTESAIIRVEEWANVLFVVCRKLGARFVSKKVVKNTMNTQPKTINYTYPTGQKIEMILTNKGQYQMYVDGVFNSRIAANDVLSVDSLAAFATTDAVFTY